MSYDYIKEANADLEKKFEERLIREFPDALLNEGDQVYIRRAGGRLMWLRANVHGGGQEWQELTPTLAIKRRRESGDISDEESLEMLRDRVAAEALKKEKPSYKTGWYQNAGGALYNYDGELWTDGPGIRVGMTLGEYNGLEYLG